MFNLVFLYAFSLGLLLANVYCFIKKKYLYLFIPCMLFLPRFYGVEISDKLPILTVSRMMHIVFYIYAFINRRRDYKIKKISLKIIPKEYWLLAGYFALRLLSNLYYITTYSHAPKSFLLIVFEQLFLLLAVYMLAPTKKELVVLTKVVVWAATVLFAVGIIESMVGARPFDALYTVSRNLYNLYYYRLGLLRATTTMYAPSLYGNMCVLMIPLIMFLYEVEKKNRYLVIAGLDILAIIHSASRSDILFLFVIAVAYVCVFYRDRQRVFLFAKNCGLIVATLSLYICVTSLISENLNYFYVGTGKSVLNEVGFDFDLNEGAPENTKGFGNNKNGGVSRTRQFTAISSVMKENPLFGYGAGATGRKQVKYFWHHSDGRDEWITATSYDVGIVETVCEEGLFGLLGVCCLIFFLIANSRGNKYLKIAVACYLLSTLSSGNMYPFLMLYTVFALCDSNGVIKARNNDKGEGLVL